MRKNVIFVLLTIAMLRVASVSAMAGEKSSVRISTSMGVIEIKLNANHAPATVANFLQYVRAGFYDGTIFHRVIPNFMIQGGGFSEDMREKPTRAPIRNEADNGLDNTVGTVAMARTGDPHSATAQFFINTKNNAFLNHHEKSQSGWGYVVFGSVSKGMDVVRKIEAVATGYRRGMGDVPLQPVLIERIQVIE
ncbi:MAG: peptidylprolyl isomerase [Mariprofundaceae bacterium]